MNATRAFLLGTTFAVSAFLTGCGMTGKVGIDADLPLDGGHVGVKFEVGSNGETTANVSSTKPLCIETCFTDANGGSLGCFTVESPASAPVPEGAESYHSTIVDCPTGESAGGSSTASGTQGSSASVQGTSVGGGLKPKHAVPKTSGTWQLLGGPIIPLADGSKNVSYSFRIQASSLANAKARRDLVLAGGIGTPVGSGFDVLLYNESAAEFDITGLPTGVRMRQAEIHDDFTTYRLTVNGFPFAELGIGANLLHYGGSNGWNVVESFVPTSAFGTNPGAFDNQAEADWTTIDTPTQWYAMQRVYTN